MSPWVLLAGAIAGEVTGTLCLRASDGFSRLWPSVVVVVGYLISFGLLAIVLKHLSVGVVYAVWSAIGVAVVAVLGNVLFGDKVPPVAVAGLVLIIVGVALVSFGGADAH